MDQQKIKRINELYKKSKAEGLTDAERKEQKILRQEYMELVRRNLRGQLNNIDIEQKDGTVINLGEKYGAKFEKKGNQKMSNGLPSDPMILLSVVDTKLRDFYPSLQALCDDMEISEAELKEKLAQIDYEYDGLKNQFV